MWGTKGYRLRLVFTSDGVVVGIVVRVVRGLTTWVKIETRSCKQSHKLDRIRVGRIRTFPFLPIPLKTPSLMIKWKLDCWSRKQKWKNKPIARPGIKYCVWLILLLLYATPTMQFSLDHKRRSYKWNRCSGSDSVGLIFNRSLYSTLLITAPTTPVKTAFIRLFFRVLHLR